MIVVVVSSLTLYSSRTSLKALLTTSPTRTSPTSRWLQKEIMDDTMNLANITNKTPGAHPPPRPSIGAQMPLPCALNVSELSIVDHAELAYNNE